MVRDILIMFFDKQKTLNGLIQKKPLKEICGNLDLSLFSEENAVYSILLKQNTEISIKLKTAINSFIQRNKGINIRKDEIIQKLLSLPYETELNKICEFISNLLLD